MLRPTKPPETIDERALRLWWPALLCGCLIFVGALVFGLRAWRMSHFPHAVATITAVWQKQVQVHRGRRAPWLEDLIFEPEDKTTTMGRIQFTRAHKGKTSDCSMDVELGVPSDATGLARNWTSSPPPEPANASTS